MSASLSGRPVLSVCRQWRRLAVFLALVGLTGCATQKSPTMKTPLPLASNVDIPRFMGDWYVIANIPTFIEKGANDAVESYAMRPDGRIATTFTFRKGSFTGPVKTYHPIGTIHDPVTRAEWRMQFVWPFQAAYLITYLDDAHTVTIIGVPSRKYAWVMARTPQIPDAQYADLVQRMTDMGYDVSRLQKVPQSPR
jgi:apolipoprotein D and lipocalin family protein